MYTSVICSRVRGTIGALCVAALAIACEQAAGQVPARDSLWRNNGWRVDTANALLRIGVTPPDSNYEFNGITRVIRLPSGGIAVAESEAAGTWIKIFDAQGKYRHRVGRRGQGPGEFVTITTVAALPGDTIFAYDDMQRRLTIFGPDGSLVGTRMVRPEGREAITSLRPMADGSLIGSVSVVGSTTPLSGSEILSRRDSVAIVRFDSTTNRAQRILSFSIGEALQFRDVGLLHRFTPSAMWIVAGGSIWFAMNDRVEAREFSSTGRPLRTIRAPVLDIPLERDSIESERERWRLAVQRGGIEAEYAKVRLAHARFPANRPRFQALLADALGNLWLQKIGSQDRFVINRDGQLLGSVALPSGYHVFDIGDSWMLVRARTPDDVPYVALLRVVK